MISTASMHAVAHMDAVVCQLRITRITWTDVLALAGIGALICGLRSLFSGSQPPGSTAPERQRLGSNGGVVFSAPAVSKVEPAPATPRALFEDSQIDTRGRRADPRGRRPPPAPLGPPRTLCPPPLHPHY